jgi:hypothetical protein
MFLDRQFALLRNVVLEFFGKTVSTTGQFCVYVFSDLVHYSLVLTQICITEPFTAACQRGKEWKKQFRNIYISLVSVKGDVCISWLLRFY